MILISVCARKGSKGLPGKNEKPFMNGPSPLARAMDFAFAVQRELDHHRGEWAEVICSTDIELPEVPGSPHFHWRHRPPELAGDRVHKWMVLRDLVAWYEESTGQEADCVLDLDVTRPIRYVDDVVDLVSLFLKEQPDLAMTICPAKKHPAFDLWEVDRLGSLRLCRTGGWMAARQELSPVYQWGGEWVIDTLYLRDTGPGKVFTEGKIVGWDVDRATSFDVDDELDWTILEAVGFHVEGRQRAPDWQRRSL